MQLPSYIEYLLQTILSSDVIKLNYSELKTDYDWMKQLFLKVNDSDSDQPFVNVSNICILFTNSEQIILIMEENYVLSYDEWLSLIKQDLTSISAFDVFNIITLKWPKEIPDINKARINEYRQQLQKINWKHSFSANSISFECIGESVVVQQFVESKLFDKKPKQTKTKIFVSDVLGKKCDVTHKCLLIVNGFVRKYENDYELFIPQQVLDVLLFMYAKPIAIKMEHKNSTAQIMLCIITDDWNSVLSKIINGFHMTIHPLVATYLIKIFYQYGDKNNLVDPENGITEIIQNTDKIFQVKAEGRFRAKDIPDKHLLEMMFEFFCSHGKTLQIDGISNLSIDEQLNIIEFDGILSMDKIKQKTNALCNKLPDLKHTAYKRIRFKSILWSFYKKYIASALETESHTKWSPTELALSLFIYLIKILQKPDVTEKTKNKGSVQFWKFVYFTLKYCQEESFDGQQLDLFYNDVTKNGTKTGGFGLKFVQKICNKFLLRFGSFAKVKKHIGAWYREVRNLKWYWMDWKESKWIPYRDVDQQILNHAYRYKEEKCNVVNGKYRVEFDKSGSFGNQFENTTLMMA
eukprot:493959_1